MSLNEPISSHHLLRTQRVSASGALSVRHRDGCSRRYRLYQDGAAKIRLPDTAGSHLEAVLINTAGGLTGGDRLDWTVDLEEGAAATVTTQACEKIYRSNGGHAALTAKATVAAGATLHWLPQEAILFDRCALHRRLDADLAADATGLFAEAAIFGRRAMGEAVSIADFRDRWRIRQNGQMVHAEDFAIGPDVADRLARRAALNGQAAMATVLLIAPDSDARLDAVRAIVGETGGASHWNVGRTGKLLARLVAADGYSLRSRLVPLLRLLAGEAGLPKVWSI